MLIIAIVITTCVAFSAVGMLAWNGLGPTPPRPQIKYGEFPFRLEYEINGQVVVVEDTIIAKFKGVGYSISSGQKYLKWETYLASNKKESAVLLTTDEQTKVYCNVGYAKYYLGSKEYPAKDENVPFEYRFYTVKLQPPGTSTSGINSDQLWDKYNIRIISFEPSPPIQNTFK